MEKEIVFRINDDLVTFRRSDIEAIGFADGELLALFIFKMMYPCENFAPVADITESRLWLLEQRLEDSLKFAQEVRDGE